jgi:ABC-type sugar transport system ATPase subunit
MAQVRLRDVVKTYGPFKAVDHVSLTIEDGEFVALVGPSGCGKTTTLNLVAGLIEITGGEIHIGDRQVNDLDPKDRDIAMVFQNYALYPNKTVYKNLAFGLETARMPRPEIDKRVRAAADILQIGPLLERKPKALSGGQRQRVAMGRAIVREPSVFLFDEPLSNLDAKLRAQMRVELALLHRRLGKTTVYVTHDQVEAMTLADRIVILERGVIQQVGTPNEVFNRPRNLFVAGFIGSPVMNMFEGSVTAADAVRLAGSGATIRVPQTLTRPAGTAIVLGVRPQGLPLAAGDPTLRMRVKVAEYLGTETVLTGTLADSAEPVISAVNGDHSDLAGGEVGLAIDAKHLHVFDAASQINLVH